MGRAPCCDKANVKKGPWSPEEDAKLKSYIENHGMGGNWIALPQKIGLKRCGKSCRLRWLNYLRPNIKHGGFSEEEDKIILSLYVSIGSRWSIIAAQLPGRTDNDIKNYWNTRLKKKLFAKQRKDQQQSRRGNNLIIKQETNNYNNLMHQNPWTSNVLNYNQNPYNIHYPQHPILHNNTTNTTTTTTTTFSYENSYDNNLNNHILCETRNPNHNEGGQNTSFPVELEELMSSNQPQRVDGLDFLYGEYGNNLVNNEGSSSNNIATSWNSLASYQNLDNVLLHGIDEGIQFEDNMGFSPKL
ncbi:hypothetical protein RND81_02G055800 [Saponaria officinalis]|uniref:Uncharacterized protein n=1 Tax=Saponaria officinalis TaxID=3572 RepID=A0AAW1MRB4_SAPOF